MRMNPDRYIRTFDILNLLIGQNEGLRLTEIKQALDLPVSSVHNALQTMVSADVVSVDEDLRYSVGPRTVALAVRMVQSLDVRNVSRRALQELAKQIGDDVYLGLRLGKRVIYADRVLGNQRISLDIRLGQPLYLHSTATGKLFAALDERLAASVMSEKLPRITANTITDPRELEREYARIRQLGYAKSNEESSEGVVGYAFPIQDAASNVTAAVHVSVLAVRATKAHEKKILASAKDCTQQIEKAMGYHSEAPASKASRTPRRSSEA